MEHPNADLIERFYNALSARDGTTMAACYAPDATFEDPAFGQLDAKDAGAMWRMLASRAADLTVEVSEIKADDETDSARWIAHYTFTQTGRPVVNDVRASFRFVDGLIVEHRDRFDWWCWATHSAHRACCSAGIRCFTKPRATRRAERSPNSASTRQPGST